MIERNIQYFDNPFEHVVIDNFFDKEDYEFCLQGLNEKKELGIWNSTDKVRKRKLKKDLFDYKKDTNERFAKYFELIDSLDSIKIDPEKEYTSEYVYSLRLKDENFPEYPLHTENIYKAITVVVYMSEEPNCGTELYDNNKKFVKEIEWKNNRAFIMSGYNNQKGRLPGNSTWHTYRSAPGKIRKSFFGYTLSSLDSIKNHSLYEDYYVKGYNNNAIKINKDR